MRQAIIWTNAVPIHWCIYAALGRDLVSYINRPEVSLEALRSDVMMIDRIAIKFDGHLGSAAAEVPVKFRSDWTSLNQNLTASRLHEILL